ncbi:unnamed protein product [Rotaria socialis]|uniref:Tetratricopeptide repeat protein n=1 Tax=Rotaria socialis TaxID=392032 RepID=A0A820RFD9_9BILA|nr:unnamed protein product [Rotaria socialis]CAF4538668.1 unnamed protein product [Rotaria socialis]
MAPAFVAGSCKSEIVLFQIDIPDSYYHNVVDTLNFTCPFFKLENVSQFETESEVIFSMGALFRIESIEQYMKEELENGKYDWQNRCSVENRILLLTENFPQSSRNILNVYIKYGVFAEANSRTTTETLTTYQKDTQITDEIAEPILAMQFGEAALHIAETYLHFDRDDSLICYNYLAVIHQLEDQYTEALSIYEIMLLIASEQNNTSALLGI